MIDTHSHILYGIDDGSHSIEESLEILSIANANGVKDIVLTPHYIKDSKYNANNKLKKELLNNLQKELKRKKININLYLGNEVYIDENLPSLLNTDISTINNSNYLLIEFSLSIKPQNLEEVLDELEEAKIIPIIAHPERYTSYYKDYDFFYHLKERNCLLQGNIGSIYGHYGRKVKKMMKELLKRNLIDIIGSDIHHPHQDFYNHNLEKDLLKIVKDERLVKDILTENAKRIIGKSNN